MKIEAERTSNVMRMDMERELAMMRMAQEKELALLRMAAERDRVKPGSVGSSGGGDGFREGGRLDA